MFKESNIISLNKIKYDFYHIKLINSRINLHIIIKYIKYGYYYNR